MGSCWEGGSGFYTFGTRSFAETQISLQAGSNEVGYESFEINPAFNHSYYSMWAQEVQSYLPPDQCREESSLWTNSKSMWTRLISSGCSVSLYDCHTLDDEFLLDLAVLPVGEAASLEPYQAFVDKWGHGTVESFKFGVLEWEVILSNDNWRDQKIYMGRAGGSGNTSNGYY